MEEDRERFAECLDEIPEPDLRFSEALVISALVGRDFLESKTIKNMTNLSQPCVCLALNRLEEKDWVESRIKEDMEDNRGGTSKEWRLKKKWKAELIFSVKKYIKRKEYNIKKLKMDSYYL